MSAGSVVRSRSRGSVSRRASVLRSVVESLEGRRMLSVTTLYNTLSSATAGGVSVAVDGYGAFGTKGAGLPTEYGRFSVGSPGVIQQSALFFVPAGKYLADLAPLSQLPASAFSSSSQTSAVSSFELRGNDVRSGAPYAYRVTLTQSLSQPTDGLNFNAFVSTLRQTYDFTNLLGTANTFDVVRVLRPDRGPHPGPDGLEGTPDDFLTPDFGSFVGFYNGGRTITSYAGTTSPDEVPSDFVELRSFGGSLVGATASSDDVEGLIASNLGIPTTLYGLDGTVGAGEVSAEEE